MADENNAIEDSNTAHGDAPDALAPQAREHSEEQGERATNEPQPEAAAATEPPAAVSSVDEAAVESPLVQIELAAAAELGAGGDTPDEVVDGVATEQPALGDGDAAAVPVVDDAPAQDAPADEPALAAEAAEEVAEPLVVDPVALRLLAAPFVSAVSTDLIFYAPEIIPLPARPGRDRDWDGDRGQGEESQSSVRRRSRRRSGEERDDTGDDANTVVRVRQPRVAELITEPQRIKGSTRLEAKKQRRRDGRDAGRRRAVVTEAEFLARREAVDRTMIVRSKAGRIQIAVTEDSVLVEHYVARNQDASLIGNVYLGRVQNVLPSMEAAFVDIGRGRNAVLYSGEVDWDAAETGNQPRRIELALKSGDRVLVQVTKDPVGHKGARLTSQISLPGRYLVYVPNGSMNGISRKLPDTERARLKRILKEVLPESSGVIVRTAAEGATEEQLTLDVNRLTAQWAHISKQVEAGQAPALLHSEPDLLLKIVRDVFNEDFTKMLVQGDEAQQTIETYLRAVAPDLLDRVERYEGAGDPFDELRVTEQIEKALDRKVWLPSGGSLVIDRTEAMTVVDVNTGKFVGSGGNLEETVTKNNLEAAEEIVRQLRLRDIGGIIVVDFIDMVLESNRDLVLRRMIECLSRDRTKHQVAEVTSLGLVQMTRKKLGLGLLETFSEPCEVCAGRGVIVHHDPVVRHRGNGGGGGSNQGGRRSRGGNKDGGNSGSGSGSGGGQAQANGNGGTHSITESAKSALAQIAASTLVPAEDTAANEGGAEAGTTGAASASTRGAKRSGGDAGAQHVPTSVDEIVLPGGHDAGSPEAPRKRKKRRSSSGSGGDAPAATASSESADAGAPASSSATGNPPATQSHRGAQDRGHDRGQDRGQTQPARKSEKEQLFDSVLNALPEPKAPGQGRGRRRVTTAALTGTPVVHEQQPRAEG
ncbi:MAG: Rne/Rng family ribonuclease [Microbacteriaceae bacterium]|jgi:ribonuclease E|nr:Rne/Rng family ribonuclease [Microbacteriaceae bacterium]